MTTQLQSPLRLVLIGGGGHALVVHEAALALGMNVVGVYDDDAKCNLTVRTQARNLGSPSQIVGVGDAAWIVGVGSITLRRAFIDRLDALSASARSGLTNIIHPRAHVSPTAALGHANDTGVYVGPMACIHAYAKVGPHCIINTGAIVEHECNLESNVHVAPNATLGGNVAVGADTLIGIGATILPGVKIGRGCVIGAGAVVRRDVKDGQTVVGVPAK
jgi:acetyltransferase EpsM